jgi:hypothetical protein
VVDKVVHHVPARRDPAASAVGQVVLAAVGPAAVVAAVTTAAAAPAAVVA